MAGQGWFRYKLRRELNEDEAVALRGLAGPVYLSWAKIVVAHVNCAWIVERWLAQTGVPFFVERRPKGVPKLTTLPALPELREWVPAFLTHYQNDFILSMGHLDGVLAVHPTGCLTGDAMLVVNRGGAATRMRLDALVSKFNGAGTSRPRGGGTRYWNLTIPTMTQSNIDGAVRLNRIVAAVASGVKRVYRVTTASGRMIKATADHRFLTPDNGWRPLSDLRVGGHVTRSVRGGTRQRATAQRAQTWGMTNHPFAIRHPSGNAYVSTHRLVAEAGVNGLDIATFVARVQRAGADDLTFLDPHLWHVHHRDENMANNASENLEVLTRAAHLAKHEWWRNCAWRAAPDRVESITLVGDEPTYDLTMEGPHHNFVANGLVVENSGKSLEGIIYGLLRPGTVIFITRAAARGTIAGEIRRYTTCEPITLKGQSKQPVPMGTRFVVVGWESLKHHYTEILKLHPTTIILDESHVVSSHKRREAIVARDEEAQEAARVDGKVKMEYRRLNNRFSAAEDLCAAATHRLALTATPIRDRVRNLWGQLDLINPRAWGTFYPWAFRYAGASQNPWGGINTDGRGNNNDMAELVARLSFCIHYISQSVTHRDLPPMRRQVTYIPADELSSGQDVLRELKEHGYNSAVGEVWAKLAHAAAMKRDRVVEEAAAGAYRAPDGRGGGKVVVFTGLRADAEKIAAKIRSTDRIGLAKGTAPLTVWCAHGGAPPASRDVVREDYMAHPGPCVLVATGDSFGESLNLQLTDLAIIAMLPWTPGQIRQWEGRFWRHGMTRPVLIMYLVAEGTADEHVAHALLNKLPAVEMVAKDEVLTEFAVDLRGDEEAVAAGFLAKLTAGDDDDEDVDANPDGTRKL